MRKVVTIVLLSCLVLSLTTGGVVMGASSPAVSDAELEDKIFSEIVEKSQKAVTAMTEFMEVTNRYFPLAEGEKYNDGIFYFQDERDEQYGADVSAVLEKYPDVFDLANQDYGSGNAYISWPFCVGTVQCMTTNFIRGERYQHVLFVETLEDGSWVTANCLRYDTLTGLFIPCDEEWYLGQCGLGFSDGCQKLPSRKVSWGVVYVEDNYDGSYD